MKNYNYFLKKSCLLLQYVDQKFRNSHSITLGVKFGTNIIKSNNHFIKLHIWDTIRQNLLIRGWIKILFIYDWFLLQKVYLDQITVIGYILVFDLTHRKSFEALIKKQNEVLFCTGNDIQITIVGNKNDLPNRQKKFKKKKQNLLKKLMEIILKLLLLVDLILLGFFKIQHNKCYKKSQMVKLIHKLKYKLINIIKDLYGITIGDFEKRRNSEIVPKSQRCFVQVNYPIQKQRLKC
ncbi:unnamed protein product [Paramecium sonneborni]|uniref:Uncharacterized protein n=1 Tax=Paramecium sonneborni TaxID=65129 RepID=A0A8S1LLM6_9CILI|nr:unnamed protein product [Paramecium sonneborni]